MDIITSRNNSTIQKIKSLSNQKNRLEQGLFVVEGEHLVQEAIKSSYNIEYIVCNVDKINKYQALLENNYSKIFVTSSVYSSISDTKTPQGISAVLKINENNNTYSNKIVMLNAVQDPGNVGTIIRTADAAGFTDVIMDKDCADIYNPKTLRSTMGSVFHLNCLRVDNLIDIMLDLKKLGYSIYTSSLQGENYYAREDNNNKIALIFGNEGNGVNSAIIENSTHIFKLPMLGKAESLNVAVACGIMIYDIVRREQ